VTWQSPRKTGEHSPVFKVGRHAAICQSSRKNKRGGRIRFQATAKRFSSMKVLRNAE
jgi:hypothetical protein